MANEVKILISAVDKASATLNKVQGELKQTGQVGKTSFMGMGSSALAAIGGITAVAGAAVAAAKTAKNLADQYQAYAFQVEDFGHIVGTSAEESSKLIQAADDARISISSLQVSLKQAVSKGYEPNIEGLAKLADQYNAIIDPIERSRFAMEVFGRRSGPEMVKMLELGGAKIKEMGDSIEGTARLMTEEGITAAKDYFAAMDRIGDAAQDAKLALGGALLPAVSNVAEETANLAESAATVIPVFTAMQKAVDDGVISFEELTGLTAGYVIGTRDLAEITQYLTDKQMTLNKESSLTTSALLEERKAQQYVKETSQGAATGIDELTDATIYGGDAAWKASDAFKSMASGIAAADAQAAKLEQRKIDLQAQLDFSMPDIGGQIENFFDSKKWAAAGGKALESAFGSLNEMIVKQQVTPAQADKMFGELYIASQDIQLELGNITGEEAAQNIKNTLGKSIQDARDLVKKLKAESSFTVSSYIDIYYRYMNSKDATGQITRGRALGGPVQQNEVYIVGERGPEIFVPDTSGRVISNADSGRLAGGSGIGGSSVMVGSINIYAQPGQSPTAIANAVLSALNKKIRANMTSGIAYAG